MLQKYKNNPIFKVYILFISVYLHCLMPFSIPLCANVKWGGGQPNYIIITSEGRKNTPQ